KAFGSATATAGGSSETFTIDVKNTGVSQADNVSLTDLVVPRLIVDSIDDGDYDCSASTGQTIDCSLAHLDAGATKSITVTYHVAANTAADPSVSNTASADADDFVGPATGSDTVAIETHADVADLKTDSP